MTPILGALRPSMHEGIYFHETPMKACGEGAIWNLGWASGHLCGPIHLSASQQEALLASQGTFISGEKRFCSLQLAIGESRPGMLLNILRDTAQASTAKNYPVQSRTQECQG